jgi:peptide/nickel transport system substrate-binding protein
MRHLKPTGMVAVVLALVLGEASLTAQSGWAAVAPVAHSPTGSLQITLTAGEWPNLDPAVNTQAAADSAIMSAVFGGLFEFVYGGGALRVVPDLAIGYKFTNGGRTFQITLRHGLQFSNGDPLTASTVATNINRDLLPANACICAPDFAAVSSVAASGPSTVTLGLSRPFPPLVYSFDGTAPNWPADLSVLAKEGAAAFGQHPIGAGPFQIVKNEASAQVVLTANPHYWQPGHPLLKNLTFLSVGTDQSALDSVTTGQSQVATTVTTIPLAEQALHNSAVRVLISPATGYNFVEMNSTAPPFDNILAREAIYYATDPQALVRGLYDNVYKVVESATAPGETIYIPKVAGYRAFDLSRAKALVRQLGGLTVTLGALTNSQYWVTEEDALAAQWARAGIVVHVQVNSLEQYLQELKTGRWQALDTQWGTPDPALGLPTHFASTAPLSGTKDPVVDSLMVQAAATANYHKRVELYMRLFERMSSNADDVFLYSKPLITIVAKTVRDPTAAAYGIWEDVR